MLLAALAAAWWLYPTSPEPLELVPAQVQALLLVNEVPPNLSFLAQTRLARQFDPEDLQEMAEAYSRSGAHTMVAELARLTDSAAMMIFDLTPRETGRYRIEFGAVVKARFPSRMNSPEIRRRLIEIATARFQADGAVHLNEGPVTVLVGSISGQVLYLQEIRGLLLVANSERSYQLLEQAASGRTERLQENAAFQLGVSRGPADPDLLLFVRGGDRFGLIPQFVWGLELEGEEVRESYVELP